MNSSNNSCSVSNGSGYDYFDSFTCSCLIKADGFPPICLNGLLLVVATCAILVYAVYKFACLIRPCRTVGLQREKYISLFVIIFLECFACCWEFLRPSMNTWLFIEFLHIMTQYYIALHMTPLGYKLPRRFRVLQVLVCALFGVMVALGYTLMEGSNLMCFYQAPWILLIAMELLIVFGLSFGTLGVVECAMKTRYDSIPRCQRKSTQLSLLMCCGLPSVAGIAYYGYLTAFARVNTINCIANGDMDLTNFTLLQLFYSSFVVARYFMLWVGVAFFVPILAKQEKSHLVQILFGESQTIARRTTAYGTLNNP